MILFSVLLLVCLGLSLWLYAGAPKGTVAEIRQDGVCLRQIDLSKVKEPYEFEVKDSLGGSNLVRVEPGRICIREADCPDQVCVHRGWMSDSSAPIVCLPHRLVIEMTDGSELDAVAE